MQQATRETPPILQALSIQQPFAWLIAHGFKDIENRTWKSRHTGLFAIHASAKIDKAGLAFVRANFPQIVMPDFERVGMRGAIVGVANLTGCVESSPSPWFFGPYGFVLTDARPIQPFVPRLGQLGFFALTAEESARVMENAGPRWSPLDGVR